MKLFLLLFVVFTFIVIGCTTSKTRCNNLVGIEKEQCLDAYYDYVRNRDYREFRGGGRLDR